LLDWYEDRAQRLGAALAYYTIFALAPGLIIVMALAGMLLGPGAEQQILLEVQELIGEQGATAIAALIQNARGETLGAAGTALALIPLIFGLWGVFGELQDGLNTIWGVTPKPGRRVIAIIKQRFWSFAMVVGTGFVLLVSLVVSAWLAAVGTYIGYLLPAPALVLETVNFVLSLVVITASFALIFKLLPDVHVAWSDVWLGAALTSFFFTLGKFVIGLYLGKSAVASAYGAATLAGHRRGMGILLGSNPSIRRRIYKGVDQTPRRRCDPREDGGADHPRSSRRAGFGATACGIGCPTLRPARWASGISRTDRPVAPIVLGLGIWDAVLVGVIVVFILAVWGLSS